jgi:metal-dependent amidase/aminoacylase/carboxypeptidase family protein
VQTLVSRYTSPTEPVVISFTQIHGGVAPNVTAEKVMLTGTIRAIDQETMEQVIERLNSMMAGVEKSFGAKINIDFNLRYPSLINDRAVHERLEKTLSDVFGHENVVETGAVLASEDFAFYSRKMPCMFYFLGAKAERSEAYFLHHPKMEVNEECIPIGAEFLAQAALALLKTK